MFRLEPFPITTIQQAYLFGRMEVFEFGNNPTHSYSEVQLDNLNVEKLQSALRKMVDYHEMLRAVFNGDENTQR
jgi:yersiniabactin nonribosomal peptide synthetase